MNTKVLIGLRIKQLRKSKGMTQEELAEKAGISSKYLSSIERGKENPTLNTFMKLSRTMHLEILEIFNFSDKKKSTKDLTAFITAVMKNSDEEKLRLAVKILKAIYL